MVVGATARDLVLGLNYDIPIRRATEDIDLGVCLEEWQQFKQLKETLVATGRFQLTRSPQELIYNDTHPVDIIPFGKISDEGQIIRWPPDRNVLMSVAGFDEVYNSCISVKLSTNPLLEIKVASLPGLVVLKLLAWKDRGMTDNRDAKDIITIIENYGTPVNEDRLWNEATELLEKDGDMELAGAQLLGRDIANLTSPELLQSLLEIFKEETAESGHHKLVTAMTNTMIAGDFETKISLLKRIQTGMEEF